MDFSKLFVQSILNDMVREKGIDVKAETRAFRACKTAHDVWEYYKRISRLDQSIGDMADDPGNLASEDPLNKSTIEDFFKNVFFAGFHLSISVSRNKVADAFKEIMNHHNELASEIMMDRVSDAFGGPDKRK